MFSYNKVTSGNSQITISTTRFNLKDSPRRVERKNLEKIEVRVATKFRADLGWVRRDRDNPKFLGLALS